MPQALRSLPSWQTSFESQQPPLQMTALQPKIEPPPPPVPVLPPPPPELPPLHEPATHVEPLPQAMQVTPLVPQLEVVEVTQVVPWQHPEQLAGPQVTDETHARLKHVC